MCLCRSTAVLLTSCHCECAAGAATAASCTGPLAASARPGPCGRAGYRTFPEGGGAPPRQSTSPTLPWADRFNPKRLFAPDRLRASGRARAVLSPPDAQPLPLKPKRRVSGNPVPYCRLRAVTLESYVAGSVTTGSAGTDEVVLRRWRAPARRMRPSLRTIRADDDLRQAGDGPPSGRRLSVETPGRPPHACRPYNGADGGARDSHRHRRLALPERGWRLERDLPSAATSRSFGCRSPGTACRMSRASVACGSPVVATSGRRRAGGSCLTRRAPARGRFGRPDRSGVLGRDGSAV